MTTENAQQIPFQTEGDAGWLCIHTGVLGQANQPFSAMRQSPMA